MLPIINSYRMIVPSYLCMFCGERLWHLKFRIAFTTAKAHESFETTLREQATWQQCLWSNKCSKRLTMGARA